MEIHELVQLVTRSWTIYSLAALCAVTLLAVVSRQGRGRQAVAAGRKANATPHIVLTGPMGSGKTTLLSRVSGATCCECAVF